MKCPRLPDAKDGKPGALLRNHVEAGRLYTLCAGRHGDLVDLVRKRQGTDAP